MDRLQRLRWWLVVQGRRVPLWLVVVVTPLVVSAVAYDLAAPGSWLRSGEVLGGRLFNLPPVGLVAAGIALIVLVCTRWLVMGSREGPITVDRIVDATLTRATRAPDKSSAALTVSAILRSRLAIAGRGHPAQQGTDVRSIVPSYGAVDLTTETPVAGAPEDTYGLLARLGIRFWRTATQRLGWRIHGTLRHGLDDGTKFGLSFVVEHVATGRHDLTATVWGNSAQEVARAAAYQIASWRLQRLSPASTRKTPQWRPNAAALQDYEDATYYGAQRRFDEAVDRARKALNLDPANMLARRLLGETYEWLGHFENAMHTYASGLVMLFDDENGWSPTALVKDDPDHPLKGWPVHDADPLPVSRQASRLWSFGDGLVWRYVVVLHFSHQWVDRWVYTLEKLEEKRRASRKVNTGAARWSRETLSGDHERLAALFQPERRSEDHTRAEQGKRLRGFMHQRYAALLAREFPLLEACWFAELHERQSSFSLDPPAVRFARGSHAGSVPLSAGEWIAAERRRIPLERGSKVGRDGLRPTPAGPQTLFDWIGELEWLFCVFLARWMPDGEVSQDVSLTIGTPPALMQTVAHEVCRRFGVPLGPQAPELIREALSGGPTRSGAQGNAWQALGLDRQLVGAVASWAAHHTLRLADAEQVGATSAIDLTDPDKTRLLLLCRQLDLRSFFHRATLYELDRGPRWRWLRRLGPLRETLQDMLWLMARFSYLDRQHRLAHDKELCFEPVDAPQLRDEGRLDVVRDPWAALRVETATAARRISRFRAFGRGLLPETHEWSLWYYTACVHALVIRDRPEPVQAGVEAVIESARLTQWKRRYDPIAEFAVRALNHAIMVRGMKSLTLVEAGARDWMLYEDPDLDKLRKHPRFQRWASATFSIDTLHYGSDEQKMDAQVARLRQDEWSTDGIYGSVERWGPWSRRWWIANDTYLASSVLGVTPHIIQRWRTLAREVNQPAQVEQRAEALLDLVTQDVDAWRSLACYRRLAARLDLRLQASHRLATLAGGTLAHAAFPTYATVLQHPMTLDYRQLDDVLERLIAEAELSARRLRHGLRHPHLDQVDLDFSAEFVAAAQRWQRLHDHVERAVGR